MNNMNKKTGIIISIIMAALGLFAFIDPFSLGIGLAFVVTVGLGIYGVSNIVTYFKVEPELRNGWTLANGIILTVLAVFMLWTALGHSYGSIQLLSTLTFAIGFFTLIGGINQIQMFNVLRKESVPGSGLMLASGIMNLFLTLLILINPLFGWFGISVIWGLYLTISGIILFAESCTGKRGVYPAI